MGVRRGDHVWMGPGWMGAGEGASRSPKASGRRAPMAWEGGRNHANCFSGFSLFGGAYFGTHCRLVYGCFGFRSRRCVDGK